jgi:hypothetical protein
MATQPPRVPVALNAKQRIGGALATVLLAVVLDDGWLAAAAGSSGGSNGSLQVVAAAAGDPVGDLATAVLAYPLWLAIGLWLVTTIKVANLAMARRRGRRSAA